jgi:DNA-binding transcriptional LysR family regulator
VQERTAPVDWEDLRFFVALARAGSLSAAARTLRVSHATVGRRVAALEAVLGQSLFDRRADGFGLTDYGASVMELAVDMDERAHTIARRAGRGEALSGTVRLTATEALAERLLIPRLATFRRRHPGIALEVLVDSRSLSLAKREADLAIRVARPQAGELFTRRLATMAYGVYGAPRGDPSAWVGYDDAFAHLPEAQWLARHGRGERVVLRTNSVVAQLAAARAGYGKALLPCWLAAEERGIVAMTPPAALPEREIWLVVHRDLKDVPRVRAVMDAIVTMFDGERARFAPPAS